MTLGERLKAVRKATMSKATQEQFGEMLGVSRTSMGDYELNRVEPTDTFLMLLSLKFNVNETWLREGKGEMFAPSTAKVDRLQSDFNLTADEAMMIAAILTAAPEERQKIFDALQAVARLIKCSTK